MNKIKILVLIDHLGSGGAQTNVIQLVNGLDKEKFDVTLVCVRQKGTRFYLISSDSAEKHVCDLPNLKSIFKTIKTLFFLRKLVLRKKIQVIHSYMFIPNVLAPLVKILSYNKVKLITTRRDTGYWHSSNHWLAYQVLNPLSDKIACVCKEVEVITQKKEGVPPNKTITIYNGIDCQKLKIEVQERSKRRLDYGIGHEELVVGIVAVLRPEKRHDLFLSAAKKILDKNKRVKFMIVGGGSEAVQSQIEDYLKINQIDKHFILTGRVNDASKALSVMDVLVLCSDSEGMSNAIIEGMASRLPVIATGVGGNPELVVDGLNGFLIKKGNSGMLEEKISDLIEDETLRENMSKNSLMRCKRLFGLDVMLKSTAQLYRDLY